MVMHIVFWKLKDTGEEKDRAACEIKRQLEALVGQIEGLQTLQVHFNFNPAGYDLCLVGRYTGKEALAYYQEHPAHKKIKEYIDTKIADRAVVDYELPSAQSEL